MKSPREIAEEIVTEHEAISGILNPVSFEGLIESFTQALESRDKRVAALKEAMKLSIARSEDVGDSWCHTPLRDALKKDANIAEE